jgi:hypothetical protein
LGLLATGLLAPASPAATIFDPAIEWKSIVTPHFRINFPQELEATAQLTAAYAEEAHSLLAPYLQSTPAQRTEVTLLDSEDTTNGFALPLPNNQIFIYLSSPPADQLMGRYDSWLRDLLIHEYTHVLHMEKTAGIPSLINQVFGRSYFPNLIQPIFLIEGLAVHTETRFSTGGRGRDTAYRMYLRQAALTGNLAGLDKASGYYTIDHPGGEIPYAYGMAFIACWPSATAPTPRPNWLKRTPPTHILVCGAWMMSSKASRAKPSKPSGKISTQICTNVLKNNGLKPSRAAH